MKILILYNVAKELKKGIADDLTCEAEIIIIVPLITEILHQQGHEVETLETTLDTWDILRSKKGTIDLVFNLAEAFGGGNDNETFVPAMLEALGMPFTGASSLNMQFTLDKEKTKLVLQAYGIPGPKYQLYRSGNEEFDASLIFPLIVKPVREEASVGIRLNSVVTSHEELNARVAYVLKNYSQPALVEQFIEGREISIGLIGQYPETHIFPPLEFLFEDTETSLQQIRSYEYKWGGKKEQMVRAQLETEVTQKLNNYSQVAYTVTDCRDYARMDYRVTDKGDIYLLEVNYNPGIGPNTHGLNNTLTMMASFEDIEFEGIIQMIIQEAAKRYGLG